jgi:hypothetical protein
MRPYLKQTNKSHHKKRAGAVVQGVVPEFKPQQCKRKKFIFNEIKVQMLGNGYKPEKDQGHSPILIPLK